MKPVYSFPRAKEVKDVARPRARFGQPLTDYHYQTRSLAGARSEGHEIRSLPRSIRCVSYAEVRREARATFLAEAAAFVVLTLIAVFGLVVCVGELSEFLRIIGSA